MTAKFQALWGMTQGSAGGMTKYCVTLLLVCLDFFGFLWVFVSCMSLIAQMSSSPLLYIGYVNGASRHP